VPDDIRERARELARKELARRLEEFDLSSGDAQVYGNFLAAVQSHIAPLHDLLESTKYALSLTDLDRDST
jgi:von Willebrand factor A domain-containing protein 8